MAASGMKKGLMAAALLTLTQFSAGLGPSSPISSGTLAVVKTGERGGPQLWISQLPAGPWRRLTDGVGDETMPAFSPEGTRIAFQGWRDPYFDQQFIGEDELERWMEAVDSEIWVAALDGTSAPRRVTDAPGYDGYPTWSPEGRRIAFLSSRGSRPYQLFAANLEDGKTQALTDLDFSLADPSWSPDGRAIAVAAERNGLFNLAVYDLASRRLSFLTEFSGHERYPSWSRDGRSLYFSRIPKGRHTWNDGGYWNVYRMAADGRSDPVAITQTTSSYIFKPQELPEGRLLTFRLAPLLMPPEVLQAQGAIGGKRARFGFDVAVWDPVKQEFEAFAGLEGARLAAIWQPISDR